MANQSDEQFAPAPALQTERPAGRTCPQCGLTVPNTINVCPNDQTPLTDAPAVDKVLLGKYRFESVLGEGGMSVVYKARHPDLNLIVAVKMLHSHMLGVNSAQRFKQEAQAASTLSHPNVIRVHDFGTTQDGQPYIVMDYLRGLDLSGVLQENGPMPPKQAVEVFLQVADGLVHAHKKGIVHRDLKPSNVVLAEESDGKVVPKLVDFGIAKLAAEEAEGASKSGPSLTKTGEILGSPPYMSPEQCRGMQLDARSDIYSFGCLMFEMLTGRTPFIGDSFMDIVFKHMEDAPPTLASLKPDTSFPPRLEALIAKCLAKRRADRFETMEEVQAELDEVYQDILDPSRGRSKRMQAMVAATVFGVIMLSIGAYFCFEYLKKEPAPTVSYATQERQLALDEDAATDTLRGAIRNDGVMVVTGSTITNPYMAYMDNFPSLQRLALRNSPIDDDGLKLLATARPGKKSPKLIEFDMENSDKITDDGMKYLQKFPLQLVNLQQSQITDKGLVELSKIKTLREMIITRIEPTLVGIEALTTLPKLEFLDMTQIPQFEPVWLKTVGRMKNLKTLDIEGDCVGEELPSLAGLQKLSTLRMASMNMSNLPKDWLTKLPVFPHLGSLDLREALLTKADVAAISKEPSLTRLKLYQSNFTDEFIPALLQSKNLVSIDFRRTRLTPKGLLALHALKNLKEVIVGECPYFTQLSAEERAKFATDMSPINVVDH